MAISEILTAVPSCDKGLHLDRVDAFIDQHALYRAPHIAVQAEELNIVRPVLLDHDVDLYVNGGNGLFTNGVAFVVRDHELETSNGTAYTESILVHELAHGSNVTGKNWLSVLKPRRLGRTSLRFSTQSRLSNGCFFEEGFAELVRGKYVADQLGQPDGLGNQGAKADNLDPRIKKYIYNNGTAGLGFLQGSIAALGLERLIERDPELWNAMIGSRTDVEALLEVKQRVDIIAPGLYKRLCGLQDQTSLDNGKEKIDQALSRRLSYSGLATIICNAR